MVETLQPQGVEDDAPHDNPPVERCPADAPSTPSTQNPLSADAAQPRMYRIVRGRGTGYAVNGFSRDCLARLIDFPDIVLRMKSTETVKAGREALLVKGELPVGGRLVGVAFKRVRRPSWVKALGGVFRTHGTLRSWRTGQEMLARGIPTARPLAVIVPHRHAPGRESFLVTEWISDGVNLRQFCKALERRGPRASYSLLSAAANSMGSLIGRMHAQNVSHRDLKLANLLVADRGTRVDSYVVGLEGAAVRLQLSKRIRLRDLSRLAADSLRCPAIGRTAQLRFLKAYLATGGTGAEAWKETWRELAADKPNAEIGKRSVRHAA